VLLNVTGRIVFENKVVDPDHPDDGPQDRPIVNAYLQLWDLDVVNNDFLGSGRTDGEGRFEITYDPADAGDRWAGGPDLVLRLMDREYHYGQGDRAEAKWHVVKSFEPTDAEGKRVSVEGVNYDFGTIRAGFWEYASTEGLDDMAFTPRVMVYDGRTPQDHRSGRTLEQLQVAARHFPAHTRHALIAKFSEDHPSPDEIEGDYPVDGSTRSAALKAVAKTDEFICDLVLNGFNPRVLKRGEREDHFYADFHWDDLEQDGRHFSPNTTAHFRLDEGRLSLTGIEVQKRLAGRPSAHAPYRDPRMYKPGTTDEEKLVWERVKRLFRCNYFLFGEVATHLTETHLNVEQYIIPMRRNLFESPIAELLFPHFVGTTAVNLAANHVLLANDGIVQKCSALTSSSVRAAARRSFGTLNWHGWRPREPLTHDHHFAKIGKLYWEVLGSYVQFFFSERRSEIEANWIEIKRMSDELVSHALPYVSSAAAEYYDSGEINTDGGKFRGRHGRPAALTPVTTSEVADSEGIENLMQLCRYLLYHATFKHAWVNDLQYRMGGEIDFATLGVGDDITNPRVDASRVVPPEEAIEHPFITYILNYTQYGYIIRNEDDDMNPALIKAILAKRQDFASLGYDVRGLRSRINT